MKPIPSLLITAGRGQLVSYLCHDGKTLEKIDTVRFEEGSEKLSDLVTDQAGAFPNSAGPGTASAERLPLLEELENRCIRRIAATIKEHLVRIRPGIWGFAAPQAINRAVLDELGPEPLNTLAVNLQLNITNAAPREILKHFTHARQTEQPSAI